MRKQVAIIMLLIFFKNGIAYSEGSFCVRTHKTSLKKNLVLNFRNYFGNELLSLDSIYNVGNQTLITITNIKFYISGIQLYSKNKMVFTDQNYAHLLDAAIPQSQQIELEVPNDIQFDRIVFSVGVDSIHNVSGAMNGDLDPYKGMYWTWQSGYINLKMEGKFPGRHFPDDNFQYHIGGYQFPNNAIHDVSIIIPESHSNNIEIGLNFQIFFKTINLNQSTHIMSPSKEAVSIAEKFASLFKVISS